MSWIVKTNLTQMRFKAESTRGTYNAPLAADNDIRLHYDGELSNETTKDMIGKLANGKMTDGRHYTRERAYGLPDITCEFVKAATPQTSPKWFKLATACGVSETTTDITLEKGLLWSGQPECSGLSCLVEAYTCGSTPEGLIRKLSGVTGSMEIKAEGAQSPIVVTFSGMKGAFDGIEDRASAALDELTGNDTAIAEMFGDYSTVIGAYPTDVYAYSFSLNNEVNFVPANNDSGIAYFDVMNQSARLKITVPQAQVASKDYMNQYLTNQIEATIVITGGASSGYDMTHTACEYSKLSESTVNGVACFEIEFNVLDSASWVQK